MVSARYERMPRKRGRIDYRDEAAEVARLYRSEKIVWRKERLQAIKLLLETNKTDQEVADIVGRARSRVQAWTKAFRDGGIALLLFRDHGGGRKSSLTQEAKEAMIGKLKDGEFRTAKQFKRWLQQEHQIELSEKAVYYHLGKLGGRLKVPRPSHTKKDQEKVEEFRNILAEKMEALNLPRGKKVKLWIYDEMRYGLHPLMRKMWSLIGHRVVAPVNRRFEWGYLFGALEISSGKSEFLHTTRVAKNFDRAFLEQICNSDPECEHVVIGDGAGFHHREDKEHETPLPSNLNVLTLPPYSPELNPVEKLWDVIKDEICTVCWESLADLEKKIDSVLENFWRRSSRLRSFVTHSYLRSELNVI